MADRDAVLGDSRGLCPLANAIQRLAYYRHKGSGKRILEIPRGFEACRQSDKIMVLRKCHKTKLGTKQWMYNGLQGGG